MSGIGLLCILIIGLPIWFFVLLARTATKEPSARWGPHLRKLAPEWCLFFVLGTLFVALFLPSVSFTREDARRAACINHLRQIGLALYNYHDSYGCYPPAYTTDKQGRRLHSWRVLVLPHVEHGRLYDRLRLDEPWDSRHNQAVVKEMGRDGVPDVYKCPSEEDCRDTDTSYVMLVGPGTISDAGACSTVDQIIDGAENTVVVVEMARSGIHWMEPRDLDVSGMSFHVNDFDAPAVRSDHSGVANVLYGDAHVQTLEEEIAPEDLKALMTIAGGEDVKAVVQSR